MGDDDTTEPGAISGPSGQWYRAQSSRGARPVPDPTVLTTEQLLREIGRLEKLLETSINGVEKLVVEKFVSVGSTFTLIERQRVEQKEDTAKAVAAALAAAKEAVNEQKDAQERASTKTETAFDGQLKQLSATFGQWQAGQSTVVDDLKARVVAMESWRLGGQEQRQEARGGAAANWQIVAVVVSVLSVLAVIVMFAISASAP